MVRVKVCGLTREADLRVATDGGADAVGVVADVPVDTPRNVAVDRAAELLAVVPPFVTGTLVTMPETPEQAVSLVERVRPDALQIHGEFDREFVEAVRNATDVTLVVAIGCDEDARASTLAPVVDAFLVDSRSESGAGGTGRTHDWTATRRLVDSLDVPVVLAGGLTPTNVADAVRSVRPYAVDVASGVERRGGVKDHDAVRSFVATAHGTQELSV